MSWPPAMPLDQLSRRTWDVAVIGAGPAGSLAARQAALAGLDTVLVDAKRFPRPKVCGGCLSRRAVEVLRQSGLGHTLDRCGGMPLSELKLVVGRRTLELPLPDGLAISRSTLDAELAAAAIEAGVSFASELEAVVEPVVQQDRRWMTASRRGGRIRFAARVVVCADGLLRSSLRRLPEFASRIGRGARIGVGAMLDEPSAEYPAGQISMVVSRSGYVGLTRVEGGRLNVAAAVDPILLRNGMPHGEVVASMLAGVDMPVPAELCRAAWRGTPPMTSQPGRVAGERLFLIGDSGGYVEPFTGEGITWALVGALAASPLVARACAEWHDSLATTWESEHDRLVRGKQAVCRALTWTLRRPWSVAAAMGVCHVFPSAARHVIDRVNALPRPQHLLAIEVP